MGGEEKKMRKRLGQEKSAPPTHRHRQSEAGKGRDPGRGLEMAKVKQLFPHGFTDESELDGHRAAGE